MLKIPAIAPLGVEAAMEFAPALGVDIVPNSLPAPCASLPAAMEFPAEAFIGKEFPAAAPACFGF